MEKNKSIKELFALTRGQLIGKYAPAILACITVSMIELTVLMLASSNPATNTFSYLVKIAISIIVDLLMGILIYGQTYFFLKLARNDADINPRYVFHGFTNNIDKAVMVQLPFTLCSCITLIPVVFINLGFIDIPDTTYYKIALFIEAADTIISIIAKLFIGLAFYILCDHPEYSVQDILNESIRLMENKKGRLLLIYLSIIPVSIIGFLSCCVGLLWVSAYTQTLLANFYLDTIGESGNCNTTDSNSTDSSTDPYDCSTSDIR